MTKIVAVKAKDVDKVVPLFLAYLEFYRQSARRAKVRAFLRERHKRSESKIFLAVIDEQPVGFVQLYPTFASLAMKRSWVLYDLFVVPAARKRGVAKALMERARQLAIETGADGLTLETAASNLPAQRLYKQLGWKQDVDFRRYFLNV